MASVFFCGLKSACFVLYFFSCIFAFDCLLLIFSLLVDVAAGRICVRDWKIHLSMQSLLLSFLHGSRLMHTMEMQIGDA